MRLTSPERSASAASIIRPVRQRSIALDLPIARVRLATYAVSGACAGIRHADHGLKLMPQRQRPVEHVQFVLELRS